MQFYLLFHLAPDPHAAIPLQTTIRTTRPWQVASPPFCMPPLTPYTLIQNERLVVLQDRSPSARRHLLVIPRQHVANTNSLVHEDLALGECVLLCPEEYLCSTRISISGEILLHVYRASFYTQHGLNHKAHTRRFRFHGSGLCLLQSVQHWTKCGNDKLLSILQCKRCEALARKRFGVNWTCRLAGNPLQLLSSQSSSSATMCRPFGVWTICSESSSHPVCGALWRFLVR